MPFEKERKDKFLTSSQIEIKKVYSEQDIAGFDSSYHLGKPGQ